MIDHYDWAGGREAMLRFGPDTGPVVIAAPPLFEEANRTRAFVVTILRALAARGIASALPDLPGQGESLLGIADVGIASWRQAFAAAARAIARPVHIIAIRGGALIDGDVEAVSRWRFAPVSGKALLGELLRTRLLSGPGMIDFRLFEVPDGPPIELSGNLLSRRLLIELDSAVTPSTRPSRIVRLDSDPAPADRHVLGAPLWRRAEPGNDPALAALLADDIAAWIARCDG